MKLSRPFVLGLVFLGLASAPLRAQPEVTLEKIMGPSRWIGQWPEDVRFVPGGDSIVYLRKRDPRGQETVEIDQTGKVLAIHNTTSLPGDVSRWNSQAVFSWQGDLFLANPQRQRLTRSKATENGPRWIDGKRFVYRRSDGPVLRDLVSGSERQLASFVYEDAPASKAESFVDKQQDRLFPVLKEREELSKAQAAIQQIPELYLGAGQALVRAEVSPDLRHVLIAQSQETKPKSDKMPDYVTRDGYVELEELRIKVGDDPGLANTLNLYSLTDGSKRALPFEGLPT